MSADGRDLIHRFGKACERTPTITTITLHYDRKTGWSAVFNGTILQSQCGIATCIESIMDTALMHGKLKVDGRENLNTKMKRAVGEKQ